MSYDYVVSTGIIQADTSTLQTDVETEWKNAFGNDLIVTPDTPQGVMITAEVAARSSVLGVNTQVANQLNPNLAGGIFLEAICALMGLERQGATFTQVLGVILHGTPGTPIPAGVQVASAGNVFVSTAAVTIGGGGTVTVGFVAINAGPIPCLAGTLTAIQPNSAILGWDSCTNPNDGTPGQTKQTDAELWLARINMLGLQGLSGPASQMAAVRAVPGVTSIQFQENPTDNAVTLNGVVMAAHSVWFCVAGGTSSAIGVALLSGKTEGAGWNGAQSVTVTDPNSGISATVQYDVPAIIPVKMIVNVSQGNSSNALAASVVQAILDFANGVIQGEPGFVIGANVSPFDLAAAIANENPGVRVREVQVALYPSGAYQTTEISIAINQQASISASNIVVNII